MRDKRLLVAILACSSVVWFGGCAGDVGGGDSDSGAGHEISGCPSSGYSTRPDVQIRFPPQRCSMSLADAAAGVAFQYEVVVPYDTGPVVPIAPESCVPTGPGDLPVLERIMGVDQEFRPEYAVPCDPLTPRSLVPGVYLGTVTWNGMDEHDEAFQPGLHTFEVVTRWQHSDLESQTLEASAAMQFELLQSK